jgi:hypothetical protein
VADVAQRFSKVLVAASLALVDPQASLQPQVRPAAKRSIKDGVHTEVRPIAASASMADL